MCHGWIFAFFVYFCYFIWRSVFLFGGPELDTFRDLDGLRFANFESLKVDESLCLMHIFNIAFQHKCKLENLKL